jgi:hypothetical protein
VHTWTIGVAPIFAIDDVLDRTLGPLSKSRRVGEYTPLDCRCPTADDAARVGVLDFMIVSGMSPDIRNIR